MSRTASTEDIKKLGTIMSVWAHPDDETFFAAGIMAAARANGQTVVCITATKGELGIAHTDPLPPQEMARVRSRELTAAMEVLDVKDCRCLHFPDGGCQAAPAATAVYKLKALIDYYQPDTILTFGPDGMTGHDDHRTVCKWVAAAAQGTGITVYQAAQLRELYEKMQAADEQFNIFFNIDPPPLLEPEQCDLLFELPQNIMDKKYQALEAMPSQTKSMLDAFSREDICQMVCCEAFVRA